MVPFLRFGEFISGGPHFPLTSDALKKVLMGHASREVLLSICHAVSVVTLSLFLDCLFSSPFFVYFIWRGKFIPFTLLFC